MASIAMMIADMTENEYKEMLRQSTVTATHHHRKTAIAEAIGCSRQTLSTFLSGGPLGVEFRNTLETWLREQGYWHDEEPARAIVKETTPGYGIAEALALELEAKAAMLRSSIPEDDKKKLFGSWLRAYTEVWSQIQKRN